MNGAFCLRLVVLFPVLVLFILPQARVDGNAGLAGKAFAVGNDPSIASLGPNPSTPVCYASPSGNDSADGLTLRNAKQDAMSCYDAIPRGTIFLVGGGHGTCCEPARVGIQQAAEFG